MSTTARLVTVPRAAAGSAQGAGTASCTYLRVRTASGLGTGSSTVTWRIETPRILRTATGQGTSGYTVIGGKTVYLYYTLREWREAPAECFGEAADLIYVEPAAVDFQTA